MQQRPFKHKAFTLVELLVVIAVIAILSSLLLSTLSAAKQRAQGIACVNNSRQMSMALRMYADSFNEWLPPNPDYQATNMWVHGEMENPTDATNTALIAQSLLSPYLGGSISIFKCPGDKTDNVRTYSMSQAVGTKPYALAAVNGPWLDGTRKHVANHPWQTYGRYTDMLNPGPSQLWVFMDENPYSIDDAAFAISMNLPTEMIDWPGIYHNTSASIAFADGHSESHKWIDGRTRLYTWTSPGPQIQTAPDNPDILWLQQRTSALAR
jgi:prepilin-type N-terminal cleavage/methylation domain-containing protein/prepilin-type processing-associated H-X9-DG protein